MLPPGGKMTTRALCPTGGSLCLPRMSCVGVRLARFFVLGALLVLTGCATVDFDAPKPVDLQVTPAGSTVLGRYASTLRRAHPGLSGFDYTDDGLEALAARVVLANYAEETLDAQYYLITPDRIGLLFLDLLLKAADRGVRVRLLLDDMQTAGFDETLAALDSHPDLEIRLFNPFAGRRWRLGDVLTDFRRINRRMHHKSFTVDGQFTLVGGRNIAAEYFGAHDSQNFGDVDLLCVGPAVNEVSVMFDEYWNSRWAVPVAAVARPLADPAARLARLRVELDRNRAAVAASEYGSAVRRNFDFLTNPRDIAWHWAASDVISDPPAKVAGDDYDPALGVAESLTQFIDSARSEVTIVSPYFVPLESGMAYFQSLIDRGLRVRVLTNSLAANNHGIVHSGYMGYRRRLLRMGVELYEARVNAPVAGVSRGFSGAALATLHTKAFLVDRDRVFLGSFNWDPRSAKLNTEMGVVVNSASLGAMVAADIDEALRAESYRLQLDERGRLRWLDESGPEPIVHAVEPDVSWWRLLRVNLGRLLPIREQL